MTLQQNRLKITEEEAAILKRLQAKYNSDYKRMVWDKKLNFFQWNKKEILRKERELRRKVEMEAAVEVRSSDQAQGQAV